jgi:hypothetical protein
LFEINAQTWHGIGDLPPVDSGDTQSSGRVVRETRRDETAAFSVFDKYCDSEYKQAHSVNVYDRNFIGTILRHSLGLAKAITSARLSFLLLVSSDGTYRDAIVLSQTVST